MNMLRAFWEVLRGRAVIVQRLHDHGAGYNSPICYVGYEHLPDSYYLVDVEKVILPRDMSKPGCFGEYNHVTPNCQAERDCHRCKYVEECSNG